MKNILNKLVSGKDNKISGLIALAVVLSIALGCNCTKDLDLGNTSSTSNSSSDVSSDSNLPSKDLQSALVKETTADFAAAISSGDFTRMYDKASPDFQKTYTKEQLANTFKDFVNKKSQVLPIISKAVSSEPDFSTPPSVRSEQGLSIFAAHGRYATKPLPMNFEYEYVRRGDQWRLLKLVVKLTKETKPSTSTGSDDAAGVTLTNFQRLQTGMTYEEVTKILGKEGELLSQNEVAGYLTVMYTWKGDEGSLGANMNVIFQNGKLTTKSQFGLK